MVSLCRKYKFIFPFVLMVIGFVSCHKGGEPVPYGNGLSSSSNTEGFSNNTQRVGDADNSGEDTNDSPEGVGDDDQDGDSGAGSGAGTVVGGDDNEDEDGTTIIGGDDNEDDDISVKGGSGGAGDDGDGSGDEPKSGGIGN